MRYSCGYYRCRIFDIDIQVYLKPETKLNQQKHQNNPSKYLKKSKYEIAPIIYNISSRNTPPPNKKYTEVRKESITFTPPKKTPSPQEASSYIMRKRFSGLCLANDLCPENNIWVTLKANMLTSVEKPQLLNLMTIYVNNYKYITCTLL